MNKAQNIFHHDKLFTIGVEEEYMLCCPDSGDLINRANEIMQNLDEELQNKIRKKNTIIADSPNRSF